MYHSGVHATISGVLLAFTRPFRDAGESLSSYRLQHWLHRPVAFGILPLFALVKTCIPIESNWQTTLGQPNSILAKVRKRRCRWTGRNDNRRTTHPVRFALFCGEIELRFSGINSLNTLPAEAMNVLDTVSIISISCSPAFQYLVNPIQIGLRRYPRWSALETARVPFSMRPAIVDLPLTDSLKGTLLASQRCIRETTKTNSPTKWQVPVL